MSVLYHFMCFSVFKKEYLTYGCRTKEKENVDFLASSSFNSFDFAVLLAFLIPFIRCGEKTLLCLL